MRSAGTTLSSCMLESDIYAEWESESRTERGSSGSEAFAEAEESDGSPKRPMVYGTYLKIGSLGVTLFYCKGNCG